MSDQNAQGAETNTYDESQVRAMAEKMAEKIASERYKGYESPEEVQGLKRKNEELFEKYHKYQDLNDDDISQLKKDKERKEKDKIYALLSEGRHDEAIQELTAPRYDAWNAELSSIKEQFEAAQSSLSEREKELQAEREKGVVRDKRDFLKDLTSSDDSFKSQYFGDFFELQSKNIEIDPSTGAAYALKDGKRMIDLDGNHVTFDQYYKKMKVEHGLYWNGGQGSGIKGGGSAEGFTGNPSSWKHETKMAYIQENGREAYAKLLSKRK